MADGMQPKNAHDRIALLASTVVAADTNHASVRLPRPANGIVFVLDVTNKATDADDTLDVYIQTKIGDNWVDVVHFTQQLGNGTDAERRFAKLSCTEPQAEFANATALGAAAIRHIFGDEWRVRSDVTDGGSGGAMTFTFSVDAIVF